MVADNGEAPTSQPPPLPPLPPPSPSQPTPTQPTPQLHSIRRRSPRLVECGNSVEVPAKKKAKVTTSLVGVEFNDGGERVSFLIGDPVSDEEARRRWPWRYDIEELKKKGRYPTTKINSEDDDDELILNVKCHYLQAKILTHVFDLGDCAIVKGEEEGHDHVGRILEFFKTNTNEEYFRVQWFFRAEDTVIKDAATSNDKKRVFYSTLMNDNPLDCIVSKVKVLKVAPGINLKSIPKCDFYYDMEYNINYSTFSTIKDDVSSNNCCLSSSDKKEEIHSNGSIGKEEIHSNGSIGKEEIHSNGSIGKEEIHSNGSIGKEEIHSNGSIGKEEIHSNGSIGKEEIHSNGSIDTSINGTLTRCKSHKSELTLLDIYSGCGGMSTGLCFGAKLSGVDLSTKWAVDANKCACESLRLNHPETQIRNEYAEDFLDLIKEWDKLCKKYKVKEEKTDGHDPMLSGSQDDVTPSKADNIVAKDEYEVEKLVDICYSDLDGTNKRELKFKVRWAGYGPSDDTWEPIQGLRKCQDKIREFVHKGVKAKILPRPGDVDIICGGPPCQGISGHNRHRNFESPLEDERNYQIVVFMEIISFLKPRYVLMENVGDILRYANGSLARYAISCLVREYYQVRLGIMAAGCYGLPQYRLRVFLWGAHHDEHLPPFPLPTHDVVFKYGSPTGFERNVVAYDKGKLQNIEKCVLLKDAISDLPPVSNSESRDEMNYTNAPETEFQKFIRATKSDMLGNASLSSCDKKKPLLYDHRPFSLNEDDCLRVSRVPKRKGASFRDLPGIVFGDDNVVIRAPEPELMPSGKHWVPNYAINFNDGKNMKSFARVWWDETVSTVLCAPNYRTEAIIHPEQDRVLTIRECARLQGFPDFYALCGTVKERYRQVGNAVAVPVGRALGYTLGMALQKLSGDEPLVTLPPKFAHSTTIDLLQPPLAIEP